MRVYVFAFCAMMAAAVSATEIRDAAAALARLGFEDIRISQRDNTLYASVEPTAYRGTFRGAGVAVEELGRLFPSASDIELAITEYQSPQVAVHARRDDSGWNAQVDYETDAVLSALTQTAAIQKSTGRIDVRFYPMVSLDNHRFDKLYEYIVSIAPAVETTRAILSGGIFVGNVAGLDANLSYRLNKSLTLGMQAALLGDAYASGSGYHFDKLGEVTFLGKASYYHSPTRIEAGLTGGRFIYGDYGARLDLTRHFGEYAIGVFGILTGGEHNAGFHFAIPMGGKCQPRRGAMRMMLPEYFDWEYNMVSYYEYADERMGYQNETRPDVNHSAHYWQASYVEQYLRKYLEGSIK